MAKVRYVILTLSMFMLLITVNTGCSPKGYELPIDEKKVESNTLPEDNIKDVGNTGDMEDLEEVEIDETVPVETTPDTTEPIELVENTTETTPIQPYQVVAKFISYEDGILKAMDFENTDKEYKIRVLDEDEKMETILSFFQAGDEVDIVIDLNTVTLHSIKMIELNEESKIVSTDTGTVVITEETGISITVNDVVINYDVAPQTIDGYVMLPLRYTIRELGFVVRWQPEKNSIDCIKGDIFIRVNVGVNAYYYNNEEPVTLKKAPVVRDGRTMVPVEFFTEFLHQILTEKDK